ncbi:ABC transporter substrate-binding protein [Pseudooceanicola sp. HF7]|uniref:ABC transporter substrate-binding protein n=1 Tax=Pseudooceanicola sp. HF7 TaxID=2721560 RepID=UPI001430EC88|nr:ABC transporter substrate-binding protein [Pseudooceanicola sp. HF7]NIZ09405.1 ABC transporter substrate-binding protein [Pseudooceanicola sp. HF7]
MLRRIFAPLSAALMCMGLAGQASALDVRAAVLRIDSPRLLPISRYDLTPDDLGFAGAMLADDDNGTTGSFLGHTYETAQVSASPEDADAALDGLLADGVRLIVVMAEGPDLLRLTDRAAQEGALVLNATAPEAELRSGECRASLLHIAPSNLMLADAVAQFAVWKKWDEWFLVSGSNPADQALADAYRRAARKFGVEITEEREFEDTGGSRRTDSGHVLVQRQLPAFTQGAKRHDVLVAADDTDYFARYLPYHLATPRPVMGSAGLRPVTFHAAHEAWGTTQFQTRFEDLTGRYARPEDYNVWLALRVIGEAVTRANTNDPQEIRDYALSGAFELAAFKGQKVTFRDWNGQLRQPILLYDGMITVSVSPQEGFLHQTSPLDTLGLDRPETDCTAFN